MVFRKSSSEFSMYFLIRLHFAYQNSVKICLQLPLQFEIQLLYYINAILKLEV